MIRAKVALGLCLFLPLVCAQTALAENLVQNSGFEEKSGTLPAHWAPEAWLNDQGISYIEIAEDGYEGEACGLVENISPNDARWEQTLRVKPNTYYRFRCMVRAEGCDVTRQGANLSVKDVFGASHDVHDTAGEWQRIELYGRTGDNQNELTLMARLGGYGSETTGKAWFDAIEAEEISANDIPASAAFLNNLQPIENEPAAEALPEVGEAAAPGIEIFFLLAGIGAAFSALALLLRRGGMSPSPLAGADRAWPGALFALLGLALAARVVIAVLSPGYQVDVDCFESWSRRMVQVGPAQFYQPDLFCDYPPGYMLVLWLNGAVMNALNILPNTVASRLVLRAAPIVCDLAGAYLLYRTARKPLGQRRALGLMALYAFNPAVLVTGAAWGQVDAVLALGLFCTVWLVIQRKWQWALPVYTLCVLLKPQALMAGPLGLAALVAEIIRYQDKEARNACLKRAGIGVLATLALAAAVVLPFWGQQPADWLLNKYASTMGHYGYATVNAANLLYLLGGNWQSLNEPLFLGFTWEALGTVLMALVFLYVLCLYFRSRDPGMLWHCGALLFSGLFVLGLMMHERYLLPAILLLGGAYVHRRDSRTLIALVGFSITMLINTGMVLAFKHLIAPYEWVGALLALANLALLALQAWTVWDHAHNRVREILRTPLETKGAGADAASAQEPPFNPHADALLHPRDGRLRLGLRDWLIMGAITAAYSVLTFWNLGDTRAPQTFWTPGSPQEQVIFDLGESRDFTLYYYGGVSTHAFTVATSEDGETWSAESNAMLNEGECFRWKKYAYPISDANGQQAFDDDGKPRFEQQEGVMTARYLRVTASGGGLSLGEIAFHNPAGGVWPIAAISSGAGVTARSMPIALLIDEQNTVPDHPSYLNGTYFDEIYHARAGYEFLHDSPNLLEWSHPPLGKLLIMLCIDLFGMTPFGWRFAGTVVGILMLPVMYLLAKQLWKRTGLAAFATLLLMLDCMHFTQTRIATIDSYPVLFIMLMYLCMFRYTQMSFYHQKLGRTLIPLALSGLFMGLAIASKWIGLYAAVGLALILFYTLYRRFAERRFALDSGDGEFIRQTGAFNQSTLLTLAWCVVWFVIVPALIYYYSYTVQFRPDGGLTPARFWSMQEQMFRFHSQLKDDHFYQSKWWQWPIMAKPMWYYSTERLGGKVSTILAFGNPAVWWGGAAALITTAAVTVSTVLRRHKARRLNPSLRPNENQRILLRSACLLLVGFASQYLPWVLVPRSTYIYHFFASVPFIALCLAQCAAWAFEGRKKLGYIVCGAYLLVTLALFIAFFPFASGAWMSIDWAEAMQWNWMRQGRWLPY